MINNKIKIYLFSMLLLSSTVMAQDIHFSQFFMAPLNINPASAGTFLGDYRANFNFKEQYSTFSNAYKTYNASFDTPLVKDYRGRKVTGLGVNMYQDIAGDSKTKLFSLSASLSQTISLTSNSDLTLGIGGGYSQYSSNLIGLTWDNQFNGLRYDERLSSRENNLWTKGSYFDVSAGLLYRSFDYNGFPLEIGLSAFHLNQPKLGYLGNDKLPMKILVHARKEIELKNNRIGFVPSAFYSKQAGASELNLGMLVRYDIGLHSKYTGYHRSSAIYFGAYYRHKDAIIPQFLLRFKEKYTVGLSYDVNYSRLEAGSRYKGGLEVSFSMSGFYSKQFKVVSPVTF